MEEIHKRVLTENITFLRDNLLTDDLLDHLLGDNIITLELKQRISYEKTDGSKVSELICMLPKRGAQAFEALLNAALRTGQDHVADHLENKVSEMKEKLRAKTENFVSAWLRENVKVQEAGEVSGINMEELLGMVNSALSPTADNSNPDLKELTLGELKRILKNVFSESEPLMQGNPMSFQLNLVTKTTVVATSAKRATDMSPLPKLMKDWSIRNVCQWLELIELDSDVQEEFRCAKITGKALMHITESQLKELPRLALGDRITILASRDEYQTNPDSLHAAVPCDDSLVSVQVMSQSINHPGDSCMINLVTETLDERVQTLGHEVGPFPSASLCSYADAAVVTYLKEEVFEHEVQQGFKVSEANEYAAGYTLTNTAEPEKEVLEPASSSDDNNERFQVKADLTEAEQTSIPTVMKLEHETSIPTVMKLEHVSEPLGVNRSSSNRQEDTVWTKFQEPSETLRTFGSPSNDSFKYKKGARLSCIETRSGGNLLQPIHRFVMPSLDNPDGMKTLANESVAFACACLNDRANGTLHFGIVSEPSSGCTVHGQIVGLVLKGSWKKYEEFLTKAFKNCFSKHQLEPVLQCVSRPIFIEVVSENAPCAEFVIEIDVTPRYKICEDKEFSVRLIAEKDCYEEPAIFRILNGNVCQLKPPEKSFYMQCKGEIVRNRKMQEETAARKKNKPKDHLCEKFLHLLCDGEETFRGDHYRILVINKPDETADFESMKETFAFIGDIEWKVIFDFDAEAKVCGFLQERENVMKIAMSDDFSPRSEMNLQKIDRLKQNQEDIRNSVHPTWIFANGYNLTNDEPLSPRNWKTTKSDGFKEAVRFYGRQIPERRALVVFLLLSKDTDVVLEAAEEFLTCFPDQWLCVAEDESIGNPWIAELRRRNCIDDGTERAVFGMPWGRVQEAVGRLVAPKRINCCELPTSTGGFVILQDKVKNELLDLEVLGSFECDNSDITNDVQELRQCEVKEKEMFFQGNGVSWWNFWFQGQVCQRDILRDLRKVVVESLNGYGVDGDIGKVILRHQPGAGGTTTAKHLLWELRKDYRCGIVQAINEGQTAQQIINLYQYEDNDPKPVLLLLDNPDEEKTNLLVADLSEMAKTLTRKGEDQAKCVCLFLICLRRTKVGLQNDPRRLVLRHELTPKEQRWFKEKYKQLLAAHKRQPNLFTDPKLLISFNILKENFNKEFIQRMVRSFLENITAAKERRLLKYISLVNSFDLECRVLPTSAFDGIMVDNPWSNRSLRRGKKAFVSRWETHLSSDFRVLVNEASKPSIGYIHALRVINPLLSMEILSGLRDQGNSKISISDIALEFYDCADIFYAPSKARDDLLEISKDILKRRGRLPNGRPETDFAPLIQAIVNEETTEKASAVMEKGLQLTSDPFIAQQMARLFIRVQNWNEAVKYAAMATEQKPDNSYLWDTYGRIYERQLLEQYEKLAAGSRVLSVEEVVPIIAIALKGMNIFRKVQQTSEREKTVSTNQAGFFGELQMVVCLLDCLTYFFQDKDTLRHYILEAEYFPADCPALPCVDGVNYTEELKKLDRRVQVAVNRLDDELLQLRDEAIDEFCRNHAKYQGESLIRLKENLDSYFGEDGDSVPESLEETEKCEFRRRRIFRLAGLNLRSISDLRWKKDGMEILQKILKIAKQNVQSAQVKVDDYQTIISVNLALTSIDPEYRQTFSEYDSMVQCSRKLYELRDTSIVSHLEPYLFFVMFNWPREDTRQYISPKVIENAIRNWKDAYYKKYPKQRGEGKPFRKKDTTMFFLASGNDMESIYFQREEPGTRRNDNRVNNFWRLSNILTKLQRLTGILSNDGNEVKIQLQYGQGKQSSIFIPTSFPIRERRMWNKQVYFVIGFSWIGPKAFDITLDDPRMTQDTSSAREAQPSRDASPPPRGFASKEFYRTAKKTDLTEEDFRRKLASLDEKLIKIKKAKTKESQCLELEEDEKQLIQEESKIARDKEEFIKSRRKMMESRIPEFE